MTGRDLDPSTAFVKREPDGEYYLNHAATALLMGVDPSVLMQYYRDAGAGQAIYALPDTLRQAGIRRSKEFAAMTDSAEPDMGDALIYYARQDGVELVFEDMTGERITLCAKPFWRRDGGDARI
ncbi:hypothetical protein QSJ19_01500 [Gordonia sp. ABSL11-1]|uniref:hypothetical protein n=1 Tax=Gordonia sp. ABSL11-1 TaxID=3053924 RepID=UPI002572F120|nr:hypothetical protein [Gordonia sp. ABSL11-1]MDL9944278.1 hypothetical protein [Gordonia sp. ABSL11-1]